MPELPEVETLRRELVKNIIGKEIASFEVVSQPGHAMRTLQRISADEFKSAVVGARIKEFDRKGKYLIVALSNGKAIVFHFMLSGWLDYFKSKAEETGRAQRYARLKFTFTDGSVLLYTDPRNMGKVFLIEDRDFSGLGVLERMGIEPLSTDFTLEIFKKIAILSPSKTVKDFLTDQRKIAGIGNIYSDEIMRRAGVRPDRRMGDLNSAEIEKLYKAIPEVLSNEIKEIESGTGRSIVAWRRRGATCPDCGSEVVVAQHGTRHYYWCPGCQK